MNGNYITPEDRGEFAAIYADLLHEILASPFSETNERTGHCIKMLPGGTSFKLNLGDQFLPTCGLRRTYPKTAAVEQAWFVLGEQDMVFLRKHNCRIWDPFIEDIMCGHAGETTLFLPGIKAAYGYRWRRHFGRDQLGLAVEALRKNPTDRRIAIGVWDPREDGLGAKDQLNVPCPSMFTFNLIDGVLHSSMFIRSSDVFVGLPYDVMGHSMLMAAVAASVGAIGVGTLHVTLAHAHIYDSHYDFARKALLEEAVVPEVPLLAWTLDMIEANPDGFVRAYELQARACEWPTFAPKPELIP